MEMKTFRASDKSGSRKCRAGRLNRRLQQSRLPAAVSQFLGERRQLGVGAAVWVRTWGWEQIAKKRGPQKPLKALSEDGWT